ncbi:MAG: hypothetical protein ACI8TX_002501 [Hyphomicrobiaceae bacterium]|jgi:uncharacterized protein (TIGR00369 family)
MRIWSELLDEMVSGNRGRASHALLMNLPRIHGWERGRVWCDFEVDQRFIQPQGNLFGGYVAALADEFLGIVAMTVVPNHAPFGNTDLHTNFLRPVRGGRLSVEARVIHEGRRNILAEAEFRDSENALAVKASATFVVQPVPK